MAKAREAERPVVAGKIRLVVETMEGSVVSEDVDEVVLTAVGTGSFGVLPGHAPLIALLAPDIMNHRVGDQRAHFVVSGGFAHIGRDMTGADRVLVLADDAILPRDIDKAAVEAELAKAREQLAAMGHVDSEDSLRQHYEASIAWAEARLRAVMRIV